MSKHFDRVNNRTRAIQVSNYQDNRPTVYRMEEQSPMMDNGGGSAGLRQPARLLAHPGSQQGDLALLRVRWTRCGDFVQPRADTDLSRAHVAGNSGLQLRLHGFEGDRPDAGEPELRQRLVFPDADQDFAARFAAGARREQVNHGGRAARKRLGRFLGENAAHGRARRSRPANPTKTPSWPKRVRA